MAPRGVSGAGVAVGDGKACERIAYPWKDPSAPLLYRRIRDWRLVSVPVLHKESDEGETF
jgi:hypothetical protein